MLMIAICEDEAGFAEDLKDKLLAWAIGAGINIKIKVFSNGIPLLLSIQEEGMFDLIFMDVEMDRMNGLEAAAKIRQDDYITTLIFVSQYGNYYKDAYDVHPFQFLSKPVGGSRLRETMDSFMRMNRQRVETFTYVVNKARYSLHLSDILYFYSERRHIYIVRNGEKCSFYGKLSEVQERLEKKDCCFVRIHHSFLVNVRYIREYHYNMLVMYNGDELCISKENRKKMRDIHMLMLGENKS